MEKIKQFDIWLANLNPGKGTEPGKTRPVVIVQSNLLNAANHPSTLICPITSQISPKAEILRVFLSKELAILDMDSDVLVDQLRAIDNRRLIKKLGQLESSQEQKLKTNLRIVLDF